MKKNNNSYPLVWLCMILLAWTVSCLNGCSSKQSPPMLDCSLVFVEDNYPEGYKHQQTANNMHRSLLFVYKIKNNSKEPAYLPIHSDNVTNWKKPSELSLFIDTFRIGAKTKVRHFQSEDEETYVYDLSFNKYGYIVENRKKVIPYNHKDNLLHPGDSIFASIRVTGNLLNKAGLPSDINIYDLMYRMQVKYIPDSEYIGHSFHKIADVRQCASHYIAFRFSMDAPEIKNNPNSELQWKCNDYEMEEGRRFHHLFSGMSSYY